MSSENLSFPFRLYPILTTGIVSSYVESSIYIVEVVKLFNFLERLIEHIEPKTLNVFIIGSLLDDNPEYFKQHVNQHLPFFLLNFIRLNKDSVVNIIVISPSKESIDPIFITKSELLYKWKKINENQYQSIKYPNLKYNFFNCPIPEYIKEDFNIGFETPQILKGTTKQLPKYYFRRRKVRELLTFTDNEFEFKDIGLLDSTDIFTQYREDIQNSLTNNTDIQFVKDFYKVLPQLIDKTISLNGGNLCLNYAVFRDSWAGAPSFYFMNTFYNLFKDKMKILTYNFQYPLVDQLIDVSDKIYSYNDFTIVLHLISSPKYISILDKGKKSKYKVHSTKKYININSKYFLIKKIHADGNCMFNAILKQIQSHMSIEQLRHRTVEYILSNQFLLNEIMTNIEGEGNYNALIQKMRSEGRSEDDIKSTLQDIYFRFMRSTPDDPQLERYRIELGLPLQVYYGGTVELKAIADIIPLNIGVIEGDENNIIITNYENNHSNQKIYLRSVGLHIDIAELQNE